MKFQIKASRNDPKATIECAMVVRDIYNGDLIESVENYLKNTKYQTSYYGEQLIKSLDKATTLTRLVPSKVAFQFMFWTRKREIHDDSHVKIFNVLVEEGDVLAKVEQTGARSLRYALARCGTKAMQNNPWGIKLLNSDELNKVLEIRDKSRAELREVVEKLKIEEQKKKLQRTTKDVISWSQDVVDRVKRLKKSVRGIKGRMKEFNRFEKVMEKARAIRDKNRFIVSNLGYVVAQSPMVVINSQISGIRNTIRNVKEWCQWIEVNCLSEGSQIVSTSVHMDFRMAVVELNEVVETLKVDGLVD